MKNKIIITTAVFCILFSNGYSQITVKEDVVTDTVNIFTQYEQTAKSSNFAIMQSLILPGTGHQYLGRPRSALTYLTIDIFSLMGAIFAESHSRKVYSDSRGFAGSNAGAIGDSRNDRFWTAVGEFDDLRSYNSAVMNNRDPRSLFDPQKNEWSWYDPDDRKKYSEMRKRAGRYHLVSSICIGTMVLNRVISIVDIRASTKYKVAKSVSSVELEPSISPDLSSAGFVLRTRF